MPKISVIVCTYNGSRLLKECLSSLARQTIDCSNYEVIIVDNNSTDNTGAIADAFVKQYEHFYCIKEFEQGLSQARNRGYKEACGEYIAYIDDDAKASSDWVERILKAFETVTPAPVAVGGQYYPWYEESPPPWFSDEMEIRTWGPEKGFLQPPRARYGFSGSNMAFRKSILQSFGGFSAGFGMDGGKLGLGEETELFYRIYKDYPLFWYDPEITVLHFVPVRNMTIRYRLARTYHGGGVVVSIEGGTSRYTIIKTLLLLTYNLCIFPLRVRWWQKNWQRSFLMYAQPVMGSIGFLKAAYRRFD